ncbi:MAG: xanthine dehydrogenase family protein molybdopterin-binding subunit, partial [Leptolyngbya sp. DLM2.Bin15]
QDEILLGSDHHFHLIGSYGLTEAVARVQQRLGNPPPVVDGSRRRGVGFAIAMQGSGLAKIHEARVSLRLKPDGRYELRTGAVDVGTGSDTTLRQIIADQLSTTVEAIDLIAADTQQTPFDAGSYASATLYISGTACLRAAQELRSILLHQASQLLNVPPPDLSLSSTQVMGPISLPLTTLAEKAIAAGDTLTVEQSYAADASTLTFAVQGVEVEVDLDTGRVTVLRCVQVLDIGKAINPRICEGQAIGGTVMGLGYALQEELIRDSQGQTVNPLFRTYRLPLAKEVPPIDIEFIEQPDPHGPLGAKGIGEIGTNCTAPAVANAIANATGVRLYQLPMTPERVWRALHERHDP